MKLAGGWILKEQLALGHFAEIYRVEQELSGKEACVKILRPEGIAMPELRKAFWANGRLFSSPIHSNIVQVLGYGVLLDRPYLIEEYVPGRTVAEFLVGEGPRTPSAAFRWLKQVAGALAACHALGLVLQNLSNNNIRLMGEDLKITSIELARGPLSCPSAHCGYYWGSWEYISPEQFLYYLPLRDLPQARPAFAVTAPPDARSDLYSLGLVLYEWLSCRNPGALRKRSPLDRDIRLDCEFDPIFPEVDSIIRNLTALRLKDRCSSADQVLRRIPTGLSAR